MVCALLLVGLLATASAPRRVVQDVVPGDVAPAFATVAGRAEADDIARFLAGKSVRHGELLSRLQQTPEYRKHEADLRAAFLAGPTAPLPFGSGYQFRATESNLVFAVRM